MQSLLNGAATENIKNSWTCPGHSSSDVLLPAVIKAPWTELKVFGMAARAWVVLEPVLEACLPT